MISNLYHYLATNNSPVATFARAAKRAIHDIYLPLPAFIGKGSLYIFLGIRSIYYFLVRVFVAEPLFRAYCSKVGKNFHTSTKLHWIDGNGRLEIGDNVVIGGKSHFTFASRFSQTPTIRIGNDCNIGDNCRFIIGKQIKLGNRVMIGQDVHIRDSNGHPVNAEARRKGLLLSSDEVKPVLIEDDVWIGTGVSIGPGITIGAGSVVAAHSVIYSNVPPNSIMGGNPARKMGSSID